jgi:hypothetical protein
MADVNRYLRSTSPLRPLAALTGTFYGYIQG